MLGPSLHIKKNESTPPPPPGSSFVCLMGHPYGALMASADGLHMGLIWVIRIIARMSIPNMSIPIMSTLPKCLFPNVYCAKMSIPKMST